ncbi:hypothetical protein [Dactylosporangium sp. NPDC000521]|uniref:hypothetical protein n=1 Tax=Dactylosporangium sp. NPDC000521 TaxID=3363975 RepID=UPI0036A4EB2B
MSSVLVGMQGYGSRQTPMFGSCNHRYREGTPSTSGETCACGTFAIGQCVHCGAYVCGEVGHSTLYQGARTCGACLGPLKRAQQEKEAKSRADKQRRQDEVRAAMPSRIRAAIVAAEASLVARRVPAEAVAVVKERSFWRSGGMSGHGYEAREAYFYVVRELGSGWSVQNTVVLAEHALWNVSGRGNGRTSPLPTDGPPLLTSVRSYARWTFKARELRLGVSEPLDVARLDDAKAHQLATALEAIAAGGPVLSMDPDEVIWTTGRSKPRRYDLPDHR